jgi:hypothetical protein
LLKEASSGFQGTLHMELSAYQFLKTENKKRKPQHLVVSHFRLKVGFALSISGKNLVQIPLITPTDL